MRIQNGLILTATAALSMTGMAFAQTAAKPASAPTPPKAKIAQKRAEATAGKKIGGKVVSSTYEFEDGRWQYAVLVKNAKGEMFEVEVNATTGKVMATEKTTPADEAKEAAADKAKAASAGK